MATKPTGRALGFDWSQFDIGHFSIPSMPSSDLCTHCFGPCKFDSVVQTSEDGRKQYDHSAVGTAAYLLSAPDASPMKGVEQEHI